jgi:aldehyde dehydrogenase (NAD+)
LLVQEGVFPQVIRKLRDRIATLRVGNPLDKNTDIGAINSRMQLDKIASWSTADCSKAPSWSSRGSSCRRKASGIRRASSPA